jgi:S-adenosylmethionine-diacylgycerolhomoserine-N-methlytransferase
MGAPDHATLMDGVYRYQRHVYDATRKYYLLGRDRMIDGLDVPEGGSVLELGCGTGRNIVLAARRYPQARFYGLDISAEMLETARANLLSERLGTRALLARGDATDFDPELLFGRSRFDRIYFSYALSMIPEWERALTAAASALAIGGSLHVVDFGEQERLPRWFRGALRAWLRRFHVEPRAMLPSALAAEAERLGGKLVISSLHRGYAVHAVLRRGTRSAVQQRQAYSSAPAMAATSAWGL